MSLKKTQVRPYPASSPKRPPTPDHIKKEKIGASPASTPFNQFQYYRPQKYQGTRSVVKKISPTGRTEAAHGVGEPAAIGMHPYFQHSALEQQQIQELESFKAIEQTSQQPLAQIKAMLPALKLDNLRPTQPTSFSQRNNLPVRPSQGSFGEESPGRLSSGQKKSMMSHKLKDLNEMRRLRRHQRMSQYSGSQNSILGSPLAAMNQKFQQLEAFPADFAASQNVEDPYNQRRESHEHFAVPVVVKEMSDDEMFGEERKAPVKTLKKSSFRRPPLNQDKFLDSEASNRAVRKSIRIPIQEKPLKKSLISKKKVHSYSVLEPAPVGSLAKKALSKAKPTVTIPSTTKAGGNTPRLKQSAQLKTTTQQTSKKPGLQPILKKGTATRLVQRAPTDLGEAPKTGPGAMFKSSFVSSTALGSFNRKDAGLSKPVPQTPQAKTTISLTKAITSQSQVKQTASRPKMLTGKAEVNKVPVLPLRQKPGMLTSRQKQVQTKKITINLDLVKKKPGSNKKV